MACLYDLARIKISRRCNGYYLRWYYNGWHYWLFATGKIIFATQGEKYRTLGTQKLVVGSTQLTLEQTTAIRTITNTREIYIYTDNGWGVVRLEAASWQVFNNQTNGYDIEITLVVGSRAVSSTGFSPAIQLPPIEPSVVYCEVEIGTQIWMCINWDANYPGSKVYNNNEAYRAISGGLYTFSQVKSPGFCPAGWHVPTVAEWQTLINFVGDSTDAGGILKEAGFVYWNPPNTGAVDTYGFGNRATGYYDNASGLFLEMLNQALLLTSDEASSTLCYYIQMEYNSDNANTGTANKNQFLAVRLLKDKSLNLTPPVAIAATLVMPIQFNANWNAYAGATQYFLDVATDVGFTAMVAGFSNLNVGNVTTYPVTGLVQNTPYYYRVRADSPLWITVNSNTISQTTAYSLGLTKQGTGAGVIGMAIVLAGNCTFSFSGVARFYDDITGTTGETANKTLGAGSHTLFMKCTVGTDYIIFSDPGNVTELGDVTITANCPSINGNPFGFVNLTKFNFYLGNTFILTVDSLPDTLTYFRFLGVSFSGNTNNLPVGLSTFIVVTNSLTGDIANIPANVVTMYIGATSSISGSLADIPATCTSLTITTSGAVTGTLADLPAGLLTIGLTGTNGVTGSIADLPAGLTNLTLNAGNYSGSIAAMPAGIKYFYITCTNSISGNINTLNPALTTIRIFDSNTVTGALNTLPATCTYVAIGGTNTVSGQVSDCPANTYWFEFYNGAVTGYTTRAWVANMEYFRFAPTLGNGLSTAQVDQLLIDLAATTWTGVKILWVAGNNAARSALSNAAVAALGGMGVTVTTN